MYTCASVTNSTPYTLHPRKHTCTHVHASRNTCVHASLDSTHVHMCMCGNDSTHVNKRHSTAAMLHKCMRLTKAHKCMANRGKDTSACRTRVHMHWKHACSCLSKAHEDMCAYSALRLSKANTLRVRHKSETGKHSLCKTQGIESACQDRPGRVVGKTKDCSAGQDTRQECAPKQW